MQEKDGDYLKIDLNDDFDVKYKAEFWKGFTAKEVISGIIAMVLGGFFAYFLHKQTGIQIDICIYAAIPIWLLVMSVTVLKIQGLTLPAYLKEMYYFMQTKTLSSEMEECDYSKSEVFTMNSKKIIVPKSGTRKEKKR